MTAEAAKLRRLQRLRPPARRRTRLAVTLLATAAAMALLLVLLRAFARLFGDPFYALIVTALLALTFAPFVLPRPVGRSRW
jgi:hypothetical protein